MDGRITAAAIGNQFPEDILFRQALDLAEPQSHGISRPDNLPHGCVAPVYRGLVETGFLKIAVPFGMVDVHRQDGGTMLAGVADELCLRIETLGLRIPPSATQDIRKTGLDPGPRLHAQRTH